MKPMIENGLRIAIEEAKLSLREGHRGIGAVVLKGCQLLVQEHDTEGSTSETSAHAEARAIEKAYRLVGSDLSECTLLSTHEPCAACREAIRKARLRRVLYGYGAAATEQLLPGHLSRECAVLYNEAVREELKRLRGATDPQLMEFNRELADRRIAWFRTARAQFKLGAGDAVEQGYRLLLHKLGIDASEAPIVSREGGRVIFHSKNFCATLEACKILGLDTRRICRLGNEGAADALVRQLDPRLRFHRNYTKIRPYCPYCEERVEIEEVERQE